MRFFCLILLSYIDYEQIILLLSIFLVSNLTVHTNAQSLKDILSSSTVKDAVTSLTGGKSVTSANLSGTWNYVNPAVLLEGDNALKNVAAGAASGEIEKKLQSYCDKIGIKPGTFSYTFNTDSTFSCVFKGKTLKGTYSLQEAEKTIQLKYGNFGNLKFNTLSAQVVVTDSQLSLLFNADKLLDFLGKLSSISDNATLKAVNTLAEQYDGMKVGFELQK